MKILVTGGAGYIGSHTVQKLLEAKHEVIVLDNLSTGFIESIPSSVHFYKGSIHDTYQLVKIIKDHSIDSVMHFAAKLVVSESVVSPLLYYDYNIQGVISVAKACLQTGVKKVVFSSTAAVYGDSHSSATVSEIDPVAPINPYGASKFMSEKILRDLDLSGKLKSVSLRYFNVAGADTRGLNGQRTQAATHLVKLAAETALGKRDFISVYGNDYATPDGTCMRDYIHVEDLADLHVLAVEYLQNRGPTDVFNCGYGKGYSVQEVLMAMKQVSKVNFKIVHSPRRPGDAAHLVANADKVKSVFRWQPQRNDLNLICQTALEWERKMSNLL